MRKTALALALSAAAASAGAQSSLPGGGRGMMPPLMPTPPAAAPAPAPSSAEPPAARKEAKGPVERGTVLEEVAGKVAGIDRQAHRLRVDTAAGPVTLSLDRNTMVYTSTGLGTVLDVVPGAQIRAGRNADFLAFWVQVRAAPPAPSSTPGQGTGPAGGGSAPAGEGGGPGSGAAPAPPTT
ncbi:MAG TPA: hypothetical protein VF841_14325, partial [Anaeromyxobacter sp.]